MNFMKARSIALTMLSTMGTTIASEAQKVCLFESECWVEMSEEDNKELVTTINEINEEALELIRSVGAEGNVWFRVYKREAKYSTRRVTPNGLTEPAVRALLNNGAKFFVGSDYEDMLQRYEVGSDFFEDIIKFFSRIKNYDTNSLAKPLSFEAYYYDYSRGDNKAKVNFLGDKLKVVSNFVEKQAKAVKYVSLSTVDFTNALYNENYEYRPYLLVTDKYVVAALYRWQL